MGKKHFLIILFLLWQCLFGAHLVAEQTSHYSLSGFVKDSLSGESIPGAHVYIPDSQTGVVTNNYGFYSIMLPEGEHTVRFSFVGYREKEAVISLNSNKRLDVPMVLSIELETVEVTARQSVAKSPYMGMIELPMSQITSTSSLLGERDIMKVFQLMPGVQGGSEGTGGLFVRGGGNDQNLIILDDAIVYNANHLFGFFSLFNGDAIKDVKLVKGGFPARYGGRLSSVMDITMRDGDMQNYKGEIGLGIISSRFTAEGPLKKGQTSFLLSGRRTYLDQLVTPFLPEEEKMGYYFYDLNAKVNHKINDNQRLYVSGFFGDDSFYTRYSEPGEQNRNGLRWNNALVSLRMASAFPGGFFMNNTLLFSQYKTGFFYERINTREDQKYILDYYTGIRDYTLKTDMIFSPFPFHTVRFGGQGIYHHFSPGSFEITNEFANEQENKKASIHTFEGGAYIENEFQKGKWMYNAGLRLSMYHTSGRGYVRPEPRFMAGYNLTDNQSLKASYSHMNQYIHLLSNTSGALPTDLWLPVSGNLPAQSSNQISLGWHYGLKKHQLELTVESFYKTSDNVLTYRDGANFFFFDDQNPDADIEWEDNVTVGQSQAYGFEFLLHKRKGKVNGWLAYTWSKADVQFAEINQGESYPANFDRRHDLALVLNYEFSPRIQFSMTWVYMTGYPITIPYHTSYSFKPWDFDAHTGLNQFVQVDYFQNRNNFQTQNYHRLDISASFSKPLKYGTRIWEIGLYNAYNRMNPFSYDMATDFVTKKRVLRKNTLFPIIPSISYVRKF